MKFIYFLEIARTETTYFTPLKSQLLQQIIRRFGENIKLDNHLFISAVLDPRQKLDVFRSKF